MKIDYQTFLETKRTITDIEEISDYLDQQGQEVPDDIQALHVYGYGKRRDFNYIYECGEGGDKYYSCIIHSSEPQSTNISDLELEIYDAIEGED